MAFDLSSLWGGGGGGNSPNWGSMMGSLAGAIPSSSNPNWNWSTGLAGLSSLGGAASGAYNMAHQAALQRQLESLSKAPYNVNQYYQPMSDAAMAALQRTGAANAMAQGLTPDQWQRTYGPELQAKTETERWAQAQQMAMAGRQQQIAALTGRPQLPQIGDIGAFGNAMMTNQLRDERLKAQAQNQANYNRMLDQMDPSRWGNWGSQASTQGAQQNIPYYLQQPGSGGFNWGMPNYGGFPQTGASPAQGMSSASEGQYSGDMTAGANGIPGPNSNSAVEGQY